MIEDRQTLNWQRRMTSLMTTSIIVAALFFAVVTLYEFGRFETRLFAPQSISDDVWASVALTPATYDEQFVLARTRAAFALERELIDRRYTQANLSVATRLWTRLMGFVTGMILALVGAAFVLGKLREDVSEASAKAGVPGHEYSFSIRSASPGVVLSLLGTLLMALSITIQSTFSVQDQAIYFERGASPHSVPGPDEAIGPAGPVLEDTVKPPTKQQAGGE